LENEIIKAYHLLVKNSGDEKTYAIRSSATAEDLPNASFAGQQETYLNVKGEINLIKACHRCYASLFTDRAIKYRSDNGFDHMKVALSIGVQTMIRSDLASSGVMFTIDPDTGFDKVVLIAGAWGLGENVVQGTINTDEFILTTTLLFDKICLFCDINNINIENILDTNIEKLKARYGEKFTSERAINRNLEKEREILAR
jgi:pyruvate,water dikinase